MTNSVFNAARGSRRSQSGVSLVELMVAMTIGLFLVGAIGIIYVNTSTTSRGSTLESQMNEDASLALELLQQQVRLAGFTNVDADGNPRFSGVAVRGCDGGLGDDGADNDGTTAFSALGCDPDNEGPDALAVRYEATRLNSQSVLNSGADRPANCSHNGITDRTPGVDEGSTETLALADNRYYIANDEDGTPSLFCKGRDGPSPNPNNAASVNGFSAATALIPNIEDMQLQFAVTNTPVDGEVVPHQVTAYVSASEPLAAPVLGATQANWSRVAAVRICLIARTSRTVPTGDNSRADLGDYIDCDGTRVNNADGFLRRAYVTTVQLRNVRPRIPADYSAGNNPYAEPDAD